MGTDLTVRALATFNDLWRFDDFVVAEGARRSLDSMTARLVAFDHDGAILGFVEMTRGKGPARHAGTIRLYVGAESRGNGVGTALLERMLAWADGRGVTRIVATPYLREDGSGARKVAFFNRHGFAFEGTARKFAKLPDGTFTDAALMARVI